MKSLIIQVEFVNSINPFKEESEVNGNSKPHQSRTKNSVNQKRTHIIPQDLLIKHGQFLKTSIHLVIQRFKP